MADAPLSLDDWEIVKIKGFASLVGPLLRPVVRDARPRFGLQTNEMHANPIGSIHGGVLTTLLDQVIAIAAWNAADRQPTVTVQMDTRFLGAAKAGDFLETRAEIRHQTRSLIFVDGEVLRGDTPIATATAVMKISARAGADA
ncbi:PaaI family thioesterase [Salipiger sp. H15]|uniref:PaaI family thioesterase n=1 Tax=Alloyangia sp. H15 TaxID=3029062 RepID=A0AAU8AE87_9RHOB